MNKGRPLIHKIPVHSFGSLALEWESRKGSLPPTSPLSITFSRYSRLNTYSKGRHDLKANGTQMEQHDWGWRIHKESLGCTISCLLHNLQSSELWKKHTVRLPGVNTMTGGLDLSFGFPWNGKIPYPHQVTWSQPINMRPVRNKGRAEKPANAQVWKKARESLYQ